MSRPKIGVFLYFRPSFGGGERYLLTAASALRALGDVDFLCPFETDLSAFAERFGLDLEGIRSVRHRRRPGQLLRDLLSPRPYDLFLALDNHLEPIQYGLGRRSILHLQTPPYEPDVSRPLRAWAKLRSYDVVVCNSEYTRGFAERHGTGGRPLRVVHPPVEVDLYRPRAKKPTILSVGRFFVGRHDKRHDLLIDAFRTLLESGIEGWELCLAGSVRRHEPEHVAHLERLRERARDLPVRFVVDGTLDELRALYGEAGVYWHAAGYGIDEDRHPQFLEHFGMSIVEAMAAGAIPVVIGKGGPLEIVHDGVDGFLWREPADLVERTRTLLTAPEAEVDALRRRAQASAARFSRPRFESEIRAIARDLLSIDARS